jgi:hypothetical protein
MTTRFNYTVNRHYNMILHKSNGVSTIAMQSHRGDRKYSSYSFLTSALDGDEWSATRPVGALPPWQAPPVPIGQETRWASVLVWTQTLQEKSFASAGDRTPVVQSVVRHHTD